MAAKDIYHDTAKNALIKDGWIITDDPLTLRWGSKTLLIDLGARKLIAARKGDQTIAVEIKSFVGTSQVNDLKNALGQYILYKDILLQNHRVRLIVFDPDNEEILQWIS
ncbi:MAG: element excision factor XisH family protein [Spirulinaceae cyanobacterium]